MQLVSPQARIALLAMAFVPSFEPLPPPAAVVCCGEYAKMLPQFAFSAPDGAFAGRLLVVPQGDCIIAHGDGKSPCRLLFSGWLFTFRAGAP